MRKINLSFFAVAALFLFVACTKNSTDDGGNTGGGGGGGGAGTCDTVNMRYATNVQPILQAACYSCHGNSSMEGNVSLDAYGEVKALVDNGKLIGVITHASGFPPMPQSGGKLSDCNINKIRGWISRGAADN